MVVSQQKIHKVTTARAGTELFYGEWWGNNDDFNHFLSRTAVITAETESNFDSGSAAWTPDEGHPWFTLPNMTGYWAVGFADPHDGWFVVLGAYGAGELVFALHDGADDLAGSQRSAGGYAEPSASDLGPTFPAGAVVDVNVKDIVVAADSVGSTNLFTRGLNRAAGVRVD